MSLMLLGDHAESAKVDLAAPLILLKLLSAVILVQNMSLRLSCSNG